ncbi:MAG: hypothetical protein ACPLXC_01330 [Candidatus Pacearchaeota archaeon]
MNKRGVELSVNTIILIILALLALIITVLIFTGAMKTIIAEISSKISQAFGLWNATGAK